MDDGDGITVSLGYAASGGVGMSKALFCVFLWSLYRRPVCE